MNIQGSHESNLYFDRIKKHSKIYKSDPIPDGTISSGMGNDWTIEFFGVKITQFIYIDMSYSPEFQMIHKILYNKELLEKFLTLERRFTNLEKLEI